MLLLTRHNSKLETMKLEGLALYRNTLRLGRKYMFMEHKNYFRDIMGPSLVGGEKAFLSHSWLVACLRTYE